MNDNHKRKLITHNGAFHADDLFAAATLALVMEKQGTPYEIIRTRDIEVIEKADYVFDVGGVYDPENNRYDHHQKDAPEKRPNGVPYASFGLVWKHFGLDLCDGNKEAWQNIDDEIACPIDANDNGVDMVSLNFKNIRPYLGSRTFTVYQPTWKEKENHVDQIFLDQVVKVVDLLKREIRVSVDDVEGINIVKEAYRESEDKKIIILDQPIPRYLYQQVLSSLPEPLFVIAPSAHGSSFKVEAINKNPETYESRNPFPEDWRGFLMHQADSTEVIGTEGVFFVHRSGFLADVNTKENALKLANLAIKS